jgi:gluconate 2-dehydrogenase gamma chain
VLTLHRRKLLASVVLFLGGRVVARADMVSGALPWQPYSGAPPQAFQVGPWIYFTPDEGAAVEALADRLIPPDPQTPGGAEAGCAVFIDRQLAGPYGRQAGLYVSPPFLKGLKVQGPQDKDGPAARYRKALAALDQSCRKANGGKAFVSLSDAEKDAVISGLEKGQIELEGVDGQAFFELLIKDVQEGFFADPIYGGNRNLCSWRMIGFPGARYDYRDWVNRHNERYPLPPVGIQGRPQWTPAKT